MRISSRQQSRHLVELLSCRYTMVHIALKQGLLKLQLLCALANETRAFAQIQSRQTALAIGFAPCRMAETRCRQQGTLVFILNAEEPASLESSGRNGGSKENGLQEGAISKVFLSSVFLLNCVAIIWGTQHAAIKALINDTPPSLYSVLRFGLAALIASPYTPGLPYRIGEGKDHLSTAWRWGLELGLWMFLGFSLQAIGLESTTASRSGFLLYLNVKFVPFFSFLMFGRTISPLTWLSAFAAFAGTVLLATDGQSIGLNIGDLWSIAAAATSAMFIIRLEQASLEVE
eukprot:scaffold23108_cov240-Cylindrotheca_fusiformis.AAC.1